MSTTSYPQDEPEDLLAGTAGNMDVLLSSLSDDELDLQCVYYRWKRDHVIGRERFGYTNQLSAARRERKRRRSAK